MWFNWHVQNILLSSYIIKNLKSFLDSVFCSVEWLYSLFRCCQLHSKDFLFLTQDYTKIHKCFQIPYFWYLKPRILIYKCTWYKVLEKEKKCVGVCMCKEFRSFQVTSCCLKTKLFKTLKKNLSSFPNLIRHIYHISSPNPHVSISRLFSFDCLIISKPIPVTLCHLCGPLYLYNSIF